jgi:hypothetical protein
MYTPARYLQSLKAVFGRPSVLETVDQVEIAMSTEARNGIVLKSYFISTIPAARAV